VKTTIACIGVLTFLSACALFPHKISITWPETIEYVEALCELDMTWHDMTYSGTMSLKMDYPHMLFLEVYGPFGNTILSIKKERNMFHLVTSEETITSEQAFEKRFGITVGELMDDIAMRGEKRPMDNGHAYIERHYYRVIYNRDKNSICWRGIPGVMCLSFLEVSFYKQ